MLTNNKEITTPEYWNKIYTGNNDNAKVDASNTVRPANPFDRFSWVAGHAVGPNVLEVAAGHAHVSKRIKAAHPQWNVIASDQAADARSVARFQFYQIFSAYDIPYTNKYFNTVICCQALEYMEHKNLFIAEAERVADNLLLTVPIGEMQKWSQLEIFTEESIHNLLEPFGDILVFQRHEDLLLVKLQFKNYNGNK